MDGLISKRPSGENLTLKPSPATDSSTRFSSPYACDPPRPPKLGHEWVWFPEGYWAERVLLPSQAKSPRDKPRDFRTRRWRTRSIRSCGSQDAKPQSTSPRDQIHSVPTADSPLQSMVPQSPFLSEKAHVRSLQQPSDNFIQSENASSSLGHESIEPTTRTSQSADPKYTETVPKLKEISSGKAYTRFPWKGLGRSKHKRVQACFSSTSSFPEETR